MEIKYLSCDGQTEVLEEIVKVTFYKYKRKTTGKIIQIMECERPKGDTFFVECENVLYITNNDKLAKDIEKNK